MKKILKAFFSIIFILLILQITRAYFYCNSAPPLELWHLKSSFKEPEYRIDIEKYLEEEKIFLNSIYNKIKTKEMESIADILLTQSAHLFLIIMKI